MRFFAASLLAGMAVASPILTSTKWTPRALDNMDFQIVNLARNLESLELNLWNQGLKNFTDADFSAAGFDNFIPYLTLFRDQEIAHFTILNEAAGGGFKNCTYKFPVTTPAELIAFGQVVTTVGEGAFLGALSLLSNGTVRETAGEIIGNEARQNSYLRLVGKLDYFNAVNFDTPLTASQAYSLAEPYLFCPSSNAPIEFPLIPPINATFATAAPHMPGDEIMITWNASTVYLGDDVHIEFLSDMYSIAMPLTQTGKGMGTTTLPPMINGTAILSATNYQGPAPIPNGQNFGIGFVVVA
ncbi:hypothetical protein P7C73_g4526, partial [Tremellales sp. Uapishka_1]